MIISRSNIQSGDQISISRLNIQSADGIFNLETPTQYPDGIFNLQILIQYQDGVFNLQILVRSPGWIINLKIVICFPDQIQLIWSFSFRSQKHIKIKFSSFVTFCLVLKINQLSLRGFGIRRCTPIGSCTKFIALPSMICLFNINSMRNQTLQ